MSGYAIEIDGLTKSYKRGQKAVDGLELQVDQGSVVAFVGPNGAGKTTTIYSLLGLLIADAGRISVLGKPPGDREARRHLGFQSEIFYTYPYLTAAKALQFYGCLAGMQRAALAAAIPLQLERFGLSDTGYKKVAAFSKGMTQRLGLAQAVIHQPDLLILDEPTTGLDPTGRKLVANVIAEEKARGATVFLSSHILSELERVCDSVFMIKSGKLVLSASMSELLAGTDHWHIEVVAYRPEMAESLRNAGGQIVESRDAHYVRCAGKHKNAVLAAIASLPAQAGEVRRERRSLEDRYMEIMEERA